MLFNRLTEVYPKKNFSKKRQLEAIVRLLAYLTVLTYIYTRRIHTLMAGSITIAFVYLYYRMHNNRENFKNMEKINLNQPPTENNPLMNVLMTDYTDNPMRKEAALANKVTDDIDEYSCNPNIFTKDACETNSNNHLGNDYQFKSSMRHFYSMPSTTIPNGQDEFGKYCYGNMLSCKERHPLQCEKNNSNNRRIF